MPEESGGTAAPPARSKDEVALELMKFVALDLTRAEAED